MYSDDTSFWVTADQIHDGQSFLPVPTYIQVDSNGLILDISNEKPDAEVRFFEGIICPGLINTHCHLELSHMKGVIPRGGGLVSFLLNVMKPQEHHVRDQDMIIVLEKAWQKGIVAYGDISNTTHSISAKLAKTDIQFHTFVEALGCIESNAESNYHYYLEVLNAFREKEMSHMQATLTLHAPYSISNDLAHYINHHEMPTLLSVHSQETAAEKELFAHQSGDFLLFYETLKMPVELKDEGYSNSLEWLLAQVSEAHQLILVHNTFAEASDWQRIATRPHTFVCLCPKANLYIEETLPPVADMSEVIENICIGTDSLASNDDIDILSEMKVLMEHFPEIGIETILKWATYNGAQALKMYNKGHIKPGNLSHLVNISQDLTFSQLIV